MKIEPMNIPAVETWSRDCKLISLSNYKGSLIAHNKNINFLCSYPFISSPSRYFVYEIKGVF